MDAANYASTADDSSAVRPVKEERRKAKLQKAGIGRRAMDLLLSAPLRY